MMKVEHIWNYYWVKWQKFWGKKEIKNFLRKKEIYFEIELKRKKRWAKAWEKKGRKIQFLRQGLTRFNEVWVKKNANKQILNSRKKSSEVLKSDRVERKESLRVLFLVTEVKLDLGKILVTLTCEDILTFIILNLFTLIRYNKMNLIRMTNQWVFFN